MPELSRLRQTPISRNFNNAYVKVSGMDENGLAGTRMEYEQFAQGPLQRPLHFTAVEEIEESMRHYGLSSYELRQLGTGSFQSDWAVLEKDDVELFSDRYNKAFSLLLHPPDGMVALLFCVTAGDPLLASGSDVANDALLLIPRDCATDMTAPRLAGSEAITLTEDRFFEIANVTAPEMRAIEEVTSLRGDTRRLCELRRTTMEMIAHPEWDPLGERLHNLVAATIGWMASAKVARIDSAMARIAIAKRTQEYLEANYREAVRIEDLCRITGISARTLQRCFREYFDLTIGEYLKSVRLSAAHRALVAGRRNGGTVAEVALHHGFGHLGRFSVEFKNRFGESPSKILGPRSAARA